MKKFIYIHCMLMISSLPLLAQEELGAEAGGPPSMGGEVPVDGGLSLLLAAGAAVGSRKLFRGARKTAPAKDGDPQL